MNLRDGNYQNIKNSQFIKIKTATEKRRTGLKKIFCFLFDGLDNLFNGSDLKVDDCKKINTDNNIEELNNNISVIEEQNVVTALIDCEKNSELSSIDSFDNNVLLEKNETEFFLDEQIENIIKDNLNQQKMEIEQLKNIFNDADIKNKRAVLVNGIHNFLSKTINVGLESFDVSICKNKFVSILGSIVILNNRLRNLRKIIRKENKSINYIYYNDIAIELQSQELCVDKIKEILDDSFVQLRNLKHDFTMEFYYDMDRYPETEDIMINFMNIEYQITSKSIELDEMIKTIENEDEIKVMK